MQSCGYVRRSDWTLHGFGVTSCADLLRNAFCHIVGIQLLQALGAEHSYDADRRFPNLQLPRRVLLIFSVHNLSSFVGIEKPTRLCEWF